MDPVVAPSGSESTEPSEKEINIAMTRVSKILILVNWLIETVSSPETTAKQLKLFGTLLTRTIKNRDYGAAMNLLKKTRTFITSHLKLLDVGPESEIVALAEAGILTQNSKICHDPKGQVAIDFYTILDPTGDGAALEEVREKLRDHLRIVTMFVSESAEEKTFVRGCIQATQFTQQQSEFPEPPHIPGVAGDVMEKLHRAADRQFNTSANGDAEFQTPQEAMSVLKNGINGLLDDPDVQNMIAGVMGDFRNGKLNVEDLQKNMAGAGANNAMNGLAGLMGFGADPNAFEAAKQTRSKARGKAPGANPTAANTSKAVVPKPAPSKGSSKRARK